MTKGNNNQQRDADFHFLCIIPSGKSQSVVNEHFPLPVHYVCPCTALTKTLGEPRYISTEIQNNEQQGSSGTVQTTRVHYYSVFTWILLQCVLFLFASTAVAAAAIRLSRDDHEELRQNHRYLQEPADGNYRTDSITHRNTICPSMLCRLCDR